jgi:hypothetical protein
MQRWKRGRRSAAKAEGSGTPGRIANRVATRVAVNIRGDDPGKRARPLAAATGSNVAASAWHRLSVPQAGLLRAIATAAAGVRSEAYGPGALGAEAPLATRMRAGLVRRPRPSVATLTGGLCSQLTAEPRSDC